MMKSLREYIAESDAPTTTTGGVAAPDAKPMFKKTKEFGHDCVEVDNDTYAKCVKGKKPYARWKKYIEDPEVKSFVQKNYNKTRKLLVKNKDTGAMAYFK